MEEIKEYVSVVEAAKIMNCSPETIRLYCQRGKIKANKDPNDPYGKWHISVDDLLKKSKPRQTVFNRNYSEDQSDCKKIYLVSSDLSGACSHAKLVLGIFDDYFKALHCLKYNHFSPDIRNGGWCKTVQYGKMSFEINGYITEYTLNESFDTDTAKWKDLEETTEEFDKVDKAIKEIKEFEARLKEEKNGKSD